MDEFYTLTTLQLHHHITRKIKAQETKVQTFPLMSHRKEIKER